MGWNIIIISGAQTGAERAALDFAIKNSMPHGGWCTKGRHCSTAADGVLDASYKLKETPTEEGLEVTEWKVRDSDATVVVTLGEKPTGDAQKSIRLAKKLKKPFLHLHRGVLAASEKFIAFTDKHSARRLHVTGTTESEEPGIYIWMDNLLQKINREVEMRNSGY